MVDEKILILNLRKESLKVRKWKRSSGLMKILRANLRKHTKAKELKIDKSINERIWSSGIEKPIVKLRIRIKKVDDNTAKAELA